MGKFGSLFECFLQKPISRIPAVRVIEPNACLKPMCGRDESCDADGDLPLSRNKGCVNTAFYSRKLVVRGFEFGRVRNERFCSLSEPINQLRPDKIAIQPIGKQRVEAINIVRLSFNKAIFEELPQHPLYWSNGLYDTLQISNITRRHIIKEDKRSLFIRKFGKLSECPSSIVAREESRSH